MDTQCCSCNCFNKVNCAYNNPATLPQQKRMRIWKKNPEKSDCGCKLNWKVLRRASLVNAIIQQTTRCRFQTQQLETRQQTTMGALEKQQQIPSGWYFYWHIYFIHNFSRCVYRFTFITMNSTFYHLLLPVRPPTKLNKKASSFFHLRIIRITKCVVLSLHRRRYYMKIVGLLTF